MLAQRRPRHEPFQRGSTSRQLTQPPLATSGPPQTRHYQHIQRRTGTEAVDALSDFYVMRTEGPDNRRLPATTQVARGTATEIVDCILAPAANMQTTLLHAGIFKRDTPDGPVDVVAPRLHHLFHSHCVVITGHLAREYWPLFYESTGAARFSTLCTCTCYGLRAECEHSIFIKALTKKIPPLITVPHAQPKGRPHTAKRERQEGHTPSDKRQKGRQLTLTQIRDVNDIDAAGPDDTRPERETTQDQTPATAETPPPTDSAKRKRGRPRREADTLHSANRPITDAPVGATDATPRRTDPVAPALQPPASAQERDPAT